MISNTHSGGDHPWPVAVGGSPHFTRPESGLPPFQFRALPPTSRRAERLAALSRVASHIHCCAMPPLRVGAADGRAAFPMRWRARHQFLGSQGFVRAHTQHDVAETARLSTATMMAVPIWGHGAANRKRGLVRTIP